MAAGVAIFLAIAMGVDLLRRAQTQSPPGAERPGLFGLDFIAFYTGGRLVDEGRHRELFDLRAIKQTQDQLASENGAYLGQALGPWWNPPFYAWIFVPFSRLPFGPAMSLWIALNVASTLVASWLLARTLLPKSGWRTKLLIPTLVLLSVPFIHSVTHGQNAGTSLLIVTVAVLLWRSDRALLAGLIAGLMAYKPQHAVVLGGMLTLTLGWRAFAGLLITGTTLLLVTILTLPGSLDDFLHQMPRNVQFVQEQCVYLWERHATFKAFWRLLLQGRAVGSLGLAATFCTVACTTTVLFLLLYLTRRVARWFDPEARQSPIDKAGRDRIIAATFLATPLLMPFYFDYDLLLLTVPAVLLAGLMVRTGKMVDGACIDRGIFVLLPVAYAELLINADFAEATGINLIVPLLAAVLFSVTRNPTAVRKTDWQWSDDELPALDAVPT